MEHLFDRGESSRLSCENIKRRKYAKVNFNGKHKENAVSNADKICVSYKFERFL